MGIPKSALSYEQDYHELRELLSSPRAPEVLELPFATQKEMRHFRMRWYAFQRTCLAEQERIQDKARKNNDTAQMLASREHERLTLQCKRFEVSEQGLNGRGEWILRIASRDGKYPQASKQISALLNQVREQHNATQKAIQEHIRSHSDDALNKFLGHSTDTGRFTSHTPTTSNDPQSTTPTDPTPQDLMDIYNDEPPEQP